MAKASLKLPNGTDVQIEGTTEEVSALLAFYGGVAPGKSPETPSAAPKPRRPKKTTTSESKQADGAPDIAKIVAHVKECDDAGAIEEKILDRSSQVDRTLLPLYIVHEHLNNSFGLSSGDISAVTTELSVPVSTANASRTLSGTASRYVIGDSVRRRGQAVRYKLSRRGLKYMESVISGTPNEDA